ncbi:MAG: TonB-dependent receptor plug domain-containing protein, partial [Opitutaceae bacterium]|nr:TonB-dependent receptor plug domain-containing protein [Opitutaceae bacterium]
MKTRTSCQQKLRLSPAVMAALLLAALPAAVHAAPSVATVTTGTAGDVIEKEVHAAPDQAGKFIIERETIRMTPSTTGTIEEALRTNSAVQFDLNSRNSETLGDLTPPRISIRGSKYYDNSFLIDGMSNSNFINPAGFSYSGDGTTVAPGGEAQSAFLNPDLVGSITLYTSNIPVEYGGFLGGVIDAKTRDPRTDGLHAGFLFGNYTRDSWASMKYVEGTDPERSTSSTHQPLFERYDFSATIEGPLTRHIAGLVSYSERHSVMPVWTSLTQTPPLQYKNTSLNRNVFMKLSTYDLDTFKASLTATYAPYEREWRTAVRRDSLTTSVGGGHSVVLDAENRFSFGTLNGTLSYRHSDVSRDAANNRNFSWKSLPAHEYANWNASATAMEGAFGDYEQESDTFAAKAVMKFFPVGPKYFRNTLKLGGEFANSKTHRKTEGAAAYLWTAPTAANGIPTALAPQLDANAVGDKENAVIAGEQWLNRRSVYDPTDKTIRFNEASVFIEDTIKIERVTLRPGLRLSYEDIVGNTNLSPRFFASADALDNGLLNLFAGVNRYHGAKFLAYALHNAQGFRVEGRARWDSPWVEAPSSSSGTARRIGDLKTPYNDELNLGATLDWRKILFTLEGGLGKSRDEIRSSRDTEGSSTARVYDNSGKSDYKNLSITIERKNINLGRAGSHSIQFSATWSETK